MSHKLIPSSKQEEKTVYPKANFVRLLDPSLPRQRAEEKPMHGIINNRNQEPKKSKTQKSKQVSHLKLGQFALYLFRKSPEAPFHALGIFNAMPVSHAEQNFEFRLGGCSPSTGVRVSSKYVLIQG